MRHAVVEGFEIISSSWGSLTSTQCTVQECFLQFAAPYECRGRGRTDDLVLSQQRDAISTGLPRSVGLWIRMRRSYCYERAEDNVKHALCMLAFSLALSQISFFFMSGQLQLISNSTYLASSFFIPKRGCYGHWSGVCTSWLTVDILVNMRWTAQNAQTPGQYCYLYGLSVTQWSD